MVVPKFGIEHALTSPNVSTLFWRENTLNFNYRVFNRITKTIKCRFLGVYCYLTPAKGGFPFSAKWREIDF